MILRVKLKALCILLDGKPSRSLFPNSLADSTVTQTVVSLHGRCDVTVVSSSMWNSPWLSCWFFSKAVRQTWDRKPGCEATIEPPGYTLTKSSHHQ